MELSIQRDMNSVNIILAGTIKTIADGQVIKDAVTKVFHDDKNIAINLYIKDSFIITSSIIGYLIKSRKVDKMVLQVSVGNKELYEMLSDMNLIEAINVKKA